MAEPQDGWKTFSAEDKPAKAYTGKGRRGAPRRFGVAAVALLLLAGIGLSVLAMLKYRTLASPPVSITPPTDEVITILMCGIDYEEGRTDEESRLTDVIIYMSINVNDNSINMLQIPRDTYVAAQVPTGDTGKINAVAALGPKKPPIENLAVYLFEKMKLPVTHYITIEMDAFKELVNVLNGVEVYVPENLYEVVENPVTKQRVKTDRIVLHKGTQLLDGPSAEFFMRYREYELSDLSRLSAQRYFYFGFYKKLITDFTRGDILKLIPAYIRYVKTDIDIPSLRGLADAFLKVKSQDITLYRMPGVFGWHQPKQGDHLSVFAADKPLLTKYLNEGFRDGQQPITEKDLLLPEIPHDPAAVVAGEPVKLGAL